MTKTKALKIVAILILLIFKNAILHVEAVSVPVEVPVEVEVDPPKIIIRIF